MYGLQTNLPSRRINDSSPTGQRLIGYILYPRNFDPGMEGASRLEDKCLNAGFRMIAHEQELGTPSNQFRPVFWRALRRMMCNKCEPKRMPFSMINFEDFLYQALSPCKCGSNAGYDGLVVKTIEHIIADPPKACAFVLQMAVLKKHFVADDGICLSCCHPATKELVTKATKESVNRAG
jgi:hypothetical protein